MIKGFRELRVSCGKITRDSPDPKHSKQSSYSLWIKPFGCTPLLLLSSSFNCTSRSFSSCFLHSTHVPPLFTEIAGAQLPFLPSDALPSLTPTQSTGPAPVADAEHRTSTVADHLLPPISASIADAEHRTSTVADHLLPPSSDFSFWLNSFDDSNGNDD